MSIELLLPPCRIGFGSPVARLATAGTIGLLELRAAAEIRDLVESAGASRCLKTMQYGERVDTSLPATFALAGAWALGNEVRRYRAWCAIAAGNGWPLPALLAMIVLGIAPRRLERHLHLRSGALGKIIEPALVLYVEIARWAPTGDEELP